MVARFFTVRLNAAIHFNRQKINIRAILTHAEYDKEKWKE
jgi:mRNA interferase HigB